ncbi:MAG: hypothetical protein AAGF47_04760 [Planctomycetota bacterium]
MSQTENLLAVYTIEKQLRGLKSRLRAAERFLTEQEMHLSRLGGHKSSLESQLRQIEASAKEREGETARLDERINTLREQMNTATTNKAYQALLVEVNTLKLERGRVEEEAIGFLENADKVREELEASATQHTERSKVRDLAVTDRQQRHDEIKQRVAELQAERAAAAEAVKPDVLSELERLLEERDDDAMASIEVLDKRRHEVACTGCMVALPVELLSSLLSGTLTNCTNCGCFLYIDEEATARLGVGSKK